MNFDGTYNNNNFNIENIESKNRIQRIYILLLDSVYIRGGHRLIFLI